MSVPMFPTLSDQKKYWDSKWDRERATFPNEWALRRGEIVLALLRSLGLRRPKILDLGCGTGWFTEKLAGLGEVIGIDLSDEALSIARERVPRVTFLAGSMFEMPLPAGHFDAIVSQHVIAHVKNQEAFVDRVADLLKPNGHLIVTTANKFVMERLDWDPQPREHIEQWLTMRGLKRLLQRRFRVLRATTSSPLGERGVLRIINSYKLNAVLGLVVPRRYLEALKERAGLGYTLIVLAQRMA